MVAGQAIDEALELLIKSVEGSTGLTHHKRFVRPAVQAARTDIERTQKRKEQLRAALLEASSTDPKEGIVLRKTYCDTTLEIPS